MLAKIGKFAKRMETEREAISSSSTKVWISALLEKVFVKLNGNKRSYFILDFDDLLEEATVKDSKDSKDKRRRKRRKGRKKSREDADDFEDDAFTIDTRSGTKHEISRIGLYRIPWYTLNRQCSEKDDDIKDHHVPILLDTRT